ncbi:hypothetical protein EI555_006580 [Monodon monoceros]|uniref:CYRIA/CYRIB Rac1 binding domain-containing protein n=1 Tax=Monodon monoceros TaxID=40151 RepID=A0A4U1EIP3_MONMO|nr:hypothetical protein EI555_006580 [Monodon monoceros]
MIQIRFPVPPSGSCTWWPTFSNSCFILKLFDAKQFDGVYRMKQLPSDQSRHMSDATEAGNCGPVGNDCPLKEAFLPLRTGPGSSHTEPFAALREADSYQFNRQYLSFVQGFGPITIACENQFAGMGNLLKVLTREIENYPHFFLDFETLCVFWFPICLDAQPTEGEREIWNQISAVLQDSESILADLQAYKGAGPEIRDVCQ